MKYSIFYIIKGKAGKYNQKLVKEVGPKFGENYMIKNPLPPHITLKVPFETSRRKILEKILEDFVKKQKPAKIKINGFGNFKKFVAFLKINFSKKAIKLQRDLYKELKKNNMAKPRNHDLEFNPHATIAYGNTKNTFILIWNELNKLKKPEFDLKLDNLTLMRKSGKYWKVHKEFKIK